MTDPWDMYTSRIGVRGNTKRNAVKRKAIHTFLSYLPDNLSYTDVTIPELIVKGPRPFGGSPAQLMVTMKDILTIFAI